MKDIKLIERKISERLIKLVEVIPEMVITENKYVEKKASDRNVFYTVNDGNIKWGGNTSAKKHVLKNHDKLQEALSENIKHITEESFCDLLTEHLYLTALEKMEELLPKIQKHYPEVKIKSFDNSLTIANDESSIVVAYASEQWHVRENTCYNGDIFEDAENLIVVEPKHWWETQYYHYKAKQSPSGKFRAVRIDGGNYNSFAINSYGVHRFQFEEEAQELCNKLNAVLEGE